jgi:hypothetical protein
MFLPTSLATGLPDTTNALGASTIRAWPVKRQDDAVPGAGVAPGASVRRAQPGDRTMKASKMLAAQSCLGARTAPNLAGR